MATIDLSNDTAPAIRAAAATQSGFLRWLRHDWPYLAMLLLAVVGVVMALPVNYWLFLIPVFALISVFAGWRHFPTREGHLELMCTLALNWGALLVAVYLLYQTSLRGVMNVNANAIAMMVLLALGTFLAGVQARVWRICAMGALLALAVPAIAWMANSVMLWGVATVLIILGGVIAWWISERPRTKPV